MAKHGSLMVVGSGITSVGQLTLQAQGWIKHADKVLYCVIDPATEIWIKQLKPQAEDLFAYLHDAKPRQDAYQEMANKMLQDVRAGLDVCAVFYGHPGVFVRPVRLAIEKARQLGYTAGMIPGVSALDCLFADLNIDPAEKGCQLLDATDYLLRGRTLNTDGHVVLFQIGVVGDSDYRRAGVDARHLPTLVEELTKEYGADHEVIHYIAAKYPVCVPVIQRLPLSKVRLDNAEVTDESTLYIPPKKHPDVEAAKRKEEEEKKEATMRGRLNVNLRGPEKRAMPYRPSADTSRLANFIGYLSQNPKALAQYFLDPDAAIAAYGGLTDAERAAISSRKQDQIHAAMTDPGLAPAVPPPPDDVPVPPIVFRPANSIW